MDTAKATILTMLKEAQGEYVSSRLICDTLQTSRTAVWKHVHSLQKQGYGVEAVPHKGYRLAGFADFITAEDIQRQRSTRVMGQTVVYHESLDSTNRVARMLAQQGAKEGTLVIAEEQTEGRGRFRRKWFSPPQAGIWMSLILRPQFALAKAPFLTTLAAVAVTKVLTEVTLQQAAIKWPNDILYDGKKVGGILTEVSAEGNMIDYCVMGIGINVRMDVSVLPESLRGTVCSLQDLLEVPVARAKVVAGILAALESLYDDYCKTEDFSGIINYVRRHSAILGKQVKVETSSTTIIGIAEDVEDDGTLLIRTPDQQLVRLYSGDVDS